MEKETLDSTWSEVSTFQFDRKEGRQNLAKLYAEKKNIADFSDEFAAWYNRVS